MEKITAEVYRDPENPNIFRFKVRIDNPDIRYDTYRSHHQSLCRYCNDKDECIKEGEGYTLTGILPADHYRRELYKMCKSQIKNLINEATDRLTHGHNN